MSYSAALFRISYHFGSAVGILCVCTEPEEHTTFASKDFNFGHAYKALFISDKGIAAVSHPP